MQTAKIIEAGTRTFVESATGGSLYNADMISEIKEIPGRKWHPAEKCWSVPAESEQSLREVVRKYFLIEGEKAEYEILCLKVCGESSASRNYQGGVAVDGHDLLNTMNGQIRFKSPAFEVLKIVNGGFVKGDGYVNLKRQSSHAFAVEYVVEVKTRKGAKIEATGRASHWGSFEILDRAAEDDGSLPAAEAPKKSHKAIKKSLSPALAALQLSEGYTVRKVGGTLKVVPAKAKKGKEMAKLQAIRATIGKREIFEWQESLQKTILANKDVSFTADEMYAALESVCREGEDFDDKKFVTEYLNGFANHPFPPFRIRKDGALYKYVG